MNNEVVAIGDIHGCVKSLKALWKKLEPWKDRPHIFVGDYIDRGPDSKGVVDFLLQVRHERETVFLRGNHELMLLDSLATGNHRLWMINGGESTLSSYGNPDKISDIPDEHLEFYLETKAYHETDDYFFVHAGLPPELSISQCKENKAVEDYFYWGRDHIKSLETAWEKTVVFGHTPRPYPIRKPTMLGIDTGCTYDKLGLGKLTAVILPETEFVQQISLDL